MSSTILPPLVFIGATGAGKTTAAQMAVEMAGYRMGNIDERFGTAGRVVVEASETEDVQALKEAGFRCVFVYVTPVERMRRLQAAGRLRPGDPLPENHGPTELADHSIANIGTIDELRQIVADLLNALRV